MTVFIGMSDKAFKKIAEKTKVFISEQSFLSVKKDLFFCLFWPIIVLRN
jgi:hypothetical protein